MVDRYINIFPALFLSKLGGLFLDGRSCQIYNGILRKPQFWLGDPSDSTQYKTRLNGGCCDSGLRIGTGLFRAQNALQGLLQLDGGAEKDIQNNIEEHLTGCSRCAWCGGLS